MFTQHTNVCKTKVLQTSYVYKIKQNKNVYRQVMFTKQKFTNTLCLQNKTNVHTHVMFTNQNTKQRFTNTSCLQNKTKENLQTRYVYNCAWGVGSTVPVEGGVVSLLYGFCQCVLSLNASVSVDTLLCNTLYQYTCKQLIVG